MMRESPDMRETFDIQQRGRASKSSNPGRDLNIFYTSEAMDKYKVVKGLAEFDHQIELAGRHTFNRNRSTGSNNIEEIKLRKSKQETDLSKITEQLRRM